MLASLQNIRLQAWKKLRTIFDQYADGQTYIAPKKQIQKIIREILGEQRKGEVAYVVRHLSSIDSNNLGKVQFGQFANYLLKRHCGQVALQRMHKVRLGENHPLHKHMTLDYEKFHILVNEAYQFLGIPVPQSVTKEAFQKLDADGDQLVSYLQYFRFVESYICDKNVVSYVGKVQAKPSMNLVNEPMSEMLIRFRRLLWGELFKIYFRYDSDGNGNMDDSQMTLLLKQLLNETSKSELDYVFKNAFRMDLNGDKCFVFEQFAMFFIKHSCEIGLNRFNRSRQTGGRRDINHQDFLVLFRNSFCFLQRSLIPDELVSKVFRRIDKDKDGIISYKQYLTWANELLTYREMDGLPCFLGQVRIQQMMQPTPMRSDDRKKQHSPSVSDFSSSPSESRRVQPSSNLQSSTVVSAYSSKSRDSSPNPIASRNITTVLEDRYGHTPVSSKGHNSTQQTNTNSTLTATYISTAGKTNNLDITTPRNRQQDNFKNVSIDSTANKPNTSLTPSYNTSSKPSTSIKLQKDEKLQIINGNTKPSTAHTVSSVVSGNAPIIPSTASYSNTYASTPINISSTFIQTSNRAPLTSSNIRPLDVSSRLNMTPVRPQTHHVKFAGTSMRSQLELRSETRKAPCSSTQNTSVRVPRLDLRSARLFDVSKSARAGSQPKIYSARGLAQRIRQHTLKLLSSYDYNRNSAVDDDELEQILRKILKQNDNEVKYVTKNLTRIARTKEGKITFGNFTDFFLGLHCGEMAVQRLHVLNKYSRGKQRMMNCKEFVMSFQGALDYLEFLAPLGQLKQLFREIDTNEDGWITYGEYFEFLRNFFSYLPSSTIQALNKYPSLAVTPRSSPPVSDRQANQPENIAIKVIRQQIQSLLAKNCNHPLKLFDKQNLNDIFSHVLSLTREESSICRSAVSAYDNNGDGALTLEELANLVVEMYCGEIVLNRLDKERKFIKWEQKQLGLQDFFMLMDKSLPFLTIKPRREDLVKVFRELDNMELGYISYNKYLSFQRQRLGSGRERQNVDSVTGKTQPSNGWLKPQHARQVGGPQKA